ncbi:MAG: hypothetical protein KF819_24715 [Labilithrix sp.]|nr:hypothetical protein [Labilithrix sp.]
MERALSLGLVALGVAVLASSCATGNADDPNTGGAVSEATGDASTGGCPSPCAAGEVCSNGVCLSGSTDADGDGYPLSNDCDDRDKSIHPGATEVCNGKDDNCDGKIDEGFDEDADGYVSCALPGKVADCDDKNPAIHPGATEVCNNVDDNCDGKIDEGFDKDNDGFYTCAHGTIAIDCDDTDPKIYPGAIEICNNKDDDCNGKIDEIPKSIIGTLTPMDTHWAVAGNASPAFLSGSYLRLTADAMNQAGALWWNASYLFDTFDMTATIWIQDKPTGADGMAFAWVAGTNVAAVGGGPGFGVAGIAAANGYAVAIDTYQNTGEPAVPYMVIFKTDNLAVPIKRTTIPNVRNAADHVLRVRLEDGKLNVWLDGILYENNLMLPGYVPFSGLWGFTGGTGGASETHWVKDISMQFPNGQGCVP